MMYICQYCGRILKYPVAHKCRDGFRKRKLKFVTIMTYDEMIAVLQAAKEGKKIQYRITNEPDWEDIEDPSWNFSYIEYRAKPEPKYRPFKNADEAFNEAKKHGFWCCISKDEYRLISFIDNTLIELANEEMQSYEFREFLDFHWADTGEPCGILEKK